MGNDTAQSENLPHIHKVKQVKVSVDFELALAFIKACTKAKDSMISVLSEFISSWVNIKK